MNLFDEAIDHVANSAAKTLYMSGGRARVPIVFRGPNGAAAGVAAQHSQCLAPWYASVPGLVVLSPWSATDARGLLKAAIRLPGPVIFLEHELLYGTAFPVDSSVLDADFTLPIGKAAVERIGSQVTLISHSKSVSTCLEAVEMLAAEKGIDCEVINLRSLRPLDFETLAISLKKTNRAVVVEGGWPFCGIAAEVSAQVMEKLFDYLDAPVLRVTGADLPMPYSQVLEEAALPTTQSVVNAVRSICNLQNSAVYN